MVDGIAVVHAVFAAHILMLVAVVLGAFTEAHGRIAQGVERLVVAAAAEAIDAVDQVHPPVRNPVLSQALDVARHVARGTIQLAAFIAALLGLFGRFGFPRALGKQADARIVDHAVLTAIAADDVVVEVGLDAPALVVRVLRQHFAAVEALLFAGEDAVNDSGRKLVTAQDPRRLQHQRHA